MNLAIMSLWSIGALLQIQFWNCCIASQNLLAEDQAEYEQKINSINKRYDDYYKHLESKRQLKLENLKGAEEVRKSRIVQDIETEKFRKEFIKNKERSKGDEEKSEYEHLKASKIEDEKKEEFRKLFVKRREWLKKLKENAKVIPEKEDVGLIDPTDDLR